MSSVRPSAFIDKRFMREGLFEERLVLELIPDWIMRQLVRKTRCHSSHMRYGSARLKIKQAFTPPNPNELDNAAVMAEGLATLGT